MTQVATDTIIITNQLDTKASFGVRVDDGEQVYIPASVSIAAKVEVGEELEAALVPNSHPSQDKTPFMAVRIVRDGEPIVNVPKPRVDDFSDIDEALKDIEFPATAEEAGVMRHRLERAWRAGHIIKVEARQNPSDEPRVMWANDWKIV